MVSGTVIFHCDPDAFTHRGYPESGIWVGSVMGIDIEVEGSPVTILDTDQDTATTLLSTNVQEPGYKVILLNPDRLIDDDSLSTVQQLFIAGRLSWAQSLDGIAEWIVWSVPIAHEAFHCLDRAGGSGVAGKPALHTEWCVR